jgi:hypothetical protein
MRASSNSAHQYAERCQVAALDDRARRDAAVEQLNGLVSRLAELNRELAVLELQVLAIADVLT